MKNYLIYIFLGVFTIVTSCYEDQGNYDYHPPEEPQITNLTGKTFYAYVGDSLVIKPDVKHSLVGTDKLSFEWSIDEPVELRDYKYEGMNLKIVFGLTPSVHDARLTITDNTNNMKYFFEFKIEGRTEFSTGTIVLSDEGGIAKLSFIKPNGTLQPNLYENMHAGEKLPSGPLQLERINNEDVAGLDTYWILCSEVNNPGVVLNPSTMSRTYYITERFFETPANVQAEAIVPVRTGINLGLYNGKVYSGASTTSPFNTLYGMYGAPIAGDYTLSSHFYYANYTTTGGGISFYFMCFDTDKQQFVWFNSTPAYFGTNYEVVPAGTGFNPVDVEMDLVEILYMNNQASYAFCKDTDGTLYEYKFYLDANESKFYTNYQRPFAGSSLVKANTKWQGSTLEIIYFTSDDKIYRYNPVNEEVRALDANFGGKEVSMIQLIENGTVLMAGTEGNLYKLDVSTGQNGNILSTTTGIPGAPVDIIIKK